MAQLYTTQSREDERLPIVDDSWIEFDYEVIGLRSTTIACTFQTSADHSRQAVALVVKFFNDTGDLLEIKQGWSFSQQLASEFTYLSPIRKGTSTVHADVLIPSSAKRMTIGIRRWKRDDDEIFILSTKIEWDEGSMEIFDPTDQKNAPQTPVGWRKLEHSEPTAPVQNTSAPHEYHTFNFVNGKFTATTEQAVNSDALLFEVEPGYKYQLSANVLDVPAQAAAKACILRLRYLAADGKQELPAPEGVSKSAAHGYFTYLNGGSNAVSIPTSENHRYIEVRPRNWDVSTCRVEVSKNINIVSKSKQAQQHAFIDLACRFARHWAGTPLFVINYTGTKRIGKGHRANRSMMFSRLLEEMKIPSIYTYSPDPSDPTDVSSSHDDYLLQIPLDAFRSIAANICENVVAKQKLYIGSFPDVTFCQTVGFAKVHGWKTIYECRDDWEEFAAAGSGRWFDNVFEAFSVRQASSTHCVSPFLADKMAAYLDDASQVFISPNGTTEHFISASREQRMARSLGAWPPGATVGYFGHLTDHWFDWAAVIGTAVRLPKVRFELIGFDPPAIDIPDNMIYLGAMSHDEIISRAKQWHVGLIPFKPGRLARSVDPIKIYEYLALGLKVVSTPMGTVHQYPLTFTYPEFGLTKTVTTALKFSPPKREWSRLEAFLESATWRNRLLEMLNRAGVNLPTQPEHLQIA